MTTSAKKPGVVTWIGYLGLALLLLLPLAVLTVRSGAWQEGLLLFGLSCLGAALVLLVTLVLMLLPRYADWRKALGQRALLAAPGTLLLLTLLGSRGDYPPIHDITTDREDPPVFTAAVRERGQGSNPLDIEAETLELQHQAYPDLHTIRSAGSIEAAFEKALETASALGWEVYRKDLNAGYIEAVDTTPIMGFKDDIVIRLRTDAQGTLVDLRSVSRVGLGDIGANAARIREFSRRFGQ